MELTDAQKKALKWLHNRGGSGSFTNGQVVLAQGELAGVMRSTWNTLSVSQPPCVVIAKKRIELTETGKNVAEFWTGGESATVEDDF